MANKWKKWNLEIIQEKWKIFQWLKLSTNKKCLNTLAIKYVRCNFFNILNLKIAIRYVKFYNTEIKIKDKISSFFSHITLGQSISHKSFSEFINAKKVVKG